MEVGHFAPADETKACLFSRWQASLLHSGKQRRFRMPTAAASANSTPLRGGVLHMGRSAASSLRFEYEALVTLCMGPQIQLYSARPLFSPISILGRGLVS
jgi:hypothetical protein